MGKSRIFLYFCLALAGGIAFNSFIFTPRLVWLGFLILGIFFISVFWRYKKIAIAGFCLLFFTLGILRHQSALSAIVYPQEENTSFVGAVLKEPDIREDNIKLTVKCEEKCSPHIKGKILVTSARYPEYQYGDKLKITGKLQIPAVFEDFDYRNYLAKDAIYSVMYKPQVEYLGKIYGSPTSIIYEKILWMKDKIRNSVYQNMPSPQNSLLVGMLLGDESKMPQEWKTKFNLAGVRHITAVSGMNIMILAGILMSLGKLIGFKIGKSFYFSIILLVLYIIMVGMPASAVRAGIMGGVFLLAKKSGRPNSGIRSIIFAATAMLLENPILLRYDIGFQLSFLAVLGLVYLTPILQKYLKWQVVAMTLAAQIFTSPVLIFNFGYISWVALITNVLIVPWLFLIMVLGLIMSLAGILWQPLGWVLSLPLWLLLTYILKVIDLFS